MGQRSPTQQQRRDVGSEQNAEICSDFWEMLPFIKLGKNRGKRKLLSGCKGGRKIWRELCDVGNQFLERRSFGMKDSGPMLSQNDIEANKNVFCLDNMNTDAICAS